MPIWGRKSNTVLTSQLELTSFRIYVIYTTFASVLYQLYKHEPKASGCISDITRTRMLYIAYDTPTSKCSCLSTILKIKAILSKWIKVKVYVNQQNFVSDIQPPSCHWFPLSFLRELLMSIIRLQNIYLRYPYLLFVRYNTATPIVNST